MSTVVSFVGLFVVALLEAIAGLHVYWAVGGRWGGGAAVPSDKGQPLFQPSKTATWVVAVLLTTAALLVLGASGSLGGLVPHTVFRLGTAGVGFVFAVRAVGDFRWVGFFKRNRDSLFAKRDTAIYSPLCAALAAACAFIALVGAASP